VCLAVIWYFMGSPLFFSFSQLDNIISLTANFASLFYLLLLILVSVYSVFSLRSSSFNNTSYSNSLRKATTSTFAASLLLYIVSWLPALPFFTNNVNLFQDRSIELLAIISLPLILAIGLAVVRKENFKTINLVRFNIVLGILFFLIMPLSRTLAGEARSALELIPITIVTLLTICLMLSYSPSLPRYQ